MGHVHSFRGSDAHRHRRHYRPPGHAYRRPPGVHAHRRHHGDGRRAVCVHEQYRRCRTDAARGRRSRAAYAHPSVAPAHAAGLFDPARRPHDADRYTPQPADFGIAGPEWLRTLRTVRLHAVRRSRDGNRRAFRRSRRATDAAETEGVTRQARLAAQPAVPLQAARTHLHVARPERLDSGWQDAGREPYRSIDRPHHPVVVPRGPQRDASRPPDGPARRRRLARPGPRRSVSRTATLVGPRHRARGPGAEVDGCRQGRVRGRHDLRKLARRLGTGATRGFSFALRRRRRGYQATRFLSPDQSRVCTHQGG